MADFKLSDVAKEMKISENEVIGKLKEKGEKLADNAAITVEQMRVLGIDPQQMIDSKSERLKQMLQSRSRVAKGREVVMHDRPREEPQPVVAAPKVGMSKQELQKRKLELNKDLQKVDKEREEYQKVSDETAPVADAVVEAVSESVAPVEAVVVEQVAIQEPVATQEAPKVETPAEATTANQTKPRDTADGRANRDSRDNRDGARAQSSYSGDGRDNRQRDNRQQDSNRAGSRPADSRPSGGRQDNRSSSTSTTTPGGYQRPKGPAADQGKSDYRSRQSSGQGYQGDRSQGDRQGTQNRQGGTGRPQGDNRGGAPYGNRRDGEQGARPQGQGYGQRDGSGGGYRGNRDGRDGDDRGERGGFRQDRGTAGRPKPTIPSEGGSLLEERRRDITKKIVKEVEPAKEEAKKAKVRGGVEDTKDLSKVLSEGLDELDLETKIIRGELEEAVPVEEVEVAPKFERKQPRRRDKKKEVPVFQRPDKITIGGTVVLSELAGMIGVKAAELVKKLFNTGIMATVNASIDAETASLLSMEYGVEVESKVITEEDLIPVYVDKEEDLVTRPPVVTVMGHVDHGKTSLLDAIRRTAVASGEAGGITQHIGAYEVMLNNRKITFLDTPGHEAFTSLRARGAQVTDIVILVVAANDGVMPQTKEAIDHSKAAGVRLVVAVNKMDRPDANPDRVRQQLADYGIISDEWGGEYQFQEISAKQGTGIDDLLERVLLEADILELKGNPKRPAEGIIIESQLDKQRGPIATVLIKNGTLKRGDTFIVGGQVGKVRSLQNYLGHVVKEAGLSMPVEIMGFSEVPESGEFFMAVEDEKLAKSIIELRVRDNQLKKQAAPVTISLSDFFNKVKEGQIKELNIIVKADVQGSLEALKGSLVKLSNPEVQVHIVHDGTGGINESDVVLAQASRAIIIGFNVRPDNNAKALAEREKISIELYSIIYQAIDDVKMAMEGMLKPHTKENIVGKVEIRQVFNVPKIGRIGGAYVLEGKVMRTSRARVIRDNVVINDGKIGSLRRFTDDVKEVAHGYECGISMEKFQDIKEGDIFEIYEIVEEKRTLLDVQADSDAKARAEAAAKANE